MVNGDCVCRRLVARRTAVPDRHRVSAVRHRGLRPTPDTEQYRSALDAGRCATAVRTLSFRQRGTAVVLGDSATGPSWIATDGYRPVDNWADVAPPETSDRRPATVDDPTQHRRPAAAAAGLHRRPDRRAAGRRRRVRRPGRPGHRAAGAGQRPERGLHLGRHRQRDAAAGRGRHGGHRRRRQRDPGHRAGDARPAAAADRVPGRQRPRRRPRPRGSRSRWCPPTVSAAAGAGAAGRPRPPRSTAPSPTTCWTTTSHRPATTCILAVRDRRLDRRGVLPARRHHHLPQHRRRRRHRAAGRVRRLRRRRADHGPADRRDRARRLHHAGRLPVVHHGGRRLRRPSPTRCAAWSARRPHPATISTVQPEPGSEAATAGSIR